MIRTTRQGGRRVAQGRVTWAGGLVVERGGLEIGMNRTIR